MMLGLGLSLWQPAVYGGAPAFDPASLSPVSWFDPSDLSTILQASGVPVTADGQSVEFILDKSGGGRRMKQSGASSRPLYKTDGTLHWLLFDGIDDNAWIEVETASAYTLPSTHEVTTVASHLSLASGNSGSLWMYKQVGGGAEVELAVYNGSGTYRVRQRYPSIDTFSTGATISSPTTAAHVIAMDRRSTTDHRHYVDGVQAFTTATSSAAPNTTNRGNGVGQHGANAQFIGMRWYGAIITAPLTTDERASLTTWMGAKAGLTL